MLNGPCKDPTCDGEVTYEPEPVSGGVFMKLDKAAKDKLNEKKVVYLTCPNGHTLPYTVTSQGIS